MCVENIIDPVQFLSPKGPVADKLSGFETRPQQIQLAQAILQALEKSHHLIAEAGTGIGKSFAYLFPAAKWALQNRQNKKKVLISTYTISLQEQLIQKDIPFIRDASDIDFTVAIAKGRGNYLCRRRLDHARKRGLTLFDDPNQYLLVSSSYRNSNICVCSRIHGVH